MHINSAILAGALAASLIAVGACKQESSSSKPEPKKEGADMAAEVPVNPNDVAVIETKQGKMVAEFFHPDAPNTVKNFQKLAKQGYYDGTAFHRIVRGFMIQGGDPNSKDASRTDLGSGGPGYSIKAEFNKQKHVRGVLSMARSQDPNSAGSQFFICLDNADFLDGQYTAFGKLIAGTDVLMKIGDIPTKLDRYGQEKSVPTERVEVTKITIMPRDQALK